MIRDIILNKIGYYLWKHKIHQINIEYHEKYYDNFEDADDDDVYRGTVWIKNPNGCYLKWDFDQVLPKCNYCNNFECYRCYIDNFGYSSFNWSPYSGYNYRNGSHHTLSNYVTRIESTIDSNGQNIICFKPVALLPKNY